MKTKRKLILLCFFVSGASALIYEVVWFRSLSLVFGSSAYAVSTMLTSFMAGLALGGAIGGKVADSNRDKVSVFSKLLIAIGIFGILTSLSFHYLPFAYYKIYVRFHQNFHAFLFFQFIICFLVLIIPTTLMGMTFPVVSKLAADDMNTLGSNIGNVYSINNCGAICGSFLAGFLLIPAIGIKNTAIFSALLNVFGGLLLTQKGALPFLFCFFVSMLTFLHSKPRPYDFNIFLSGRIPNYYAILDNQESHALIFNKEDIQGNVRVYLNKNNKPFLQVSGKIEGSLESDLANEMLLAYLPLAMKPEANDFLGIGLGTGTTLHAAKKHADNITWIEINKSVVDAVDKHFYPGLRKDARIILSDARTHLLYTDEAYDIISSEPSYPTDSMTVSLFTQEFFKIAQKRLKKNGLFCQWLPYYLLSNEDVTLMVKTFQSAFPYTAVWKVAPSGDLLLTGSPDSFALFEKEIKKRIDALSGKKLSYSLVLSRNVNDTAEMLLFEKETPVNTDDLPYLEFSSVRHLVEGTGEL